MRKRSADIGILCTSRHRRHSNTEHFSLYWLSSIIVSMTSFEGTRVSAPSDNKRATSRHAVKRSENHALKKTI